MRTESHKFSLGFSTEQLLLNPNFDMPGWPWPLSSPVTHPPKAEGGRRPKAGSRSSPKNVPQSPHNSRSFLIVSPLPPPALPLGSGASLSLTVWFSIHQRYPPALDRYHLLPRDGGDLGGEWTGEGQKSQLSHWPLCDEHIAE